MLKEVKELTPYFTAAALPGSRRHAHSSLHDVFQGSMELYWKCHCALDQGDQWDGSAAGGVKERKKSLISCKKTPWFDLLEQDLVIHSPCTLCLFLHESQASFYIGGIMHLKSLSFLEGAGTRPAWPRTEPGTWRWPYTFIQGMSAQMDGLMDGQMAVEPGSEVRGQRIERDKHKLRSPRESVKEKVSVCMREWGSIKTATNVYSRAYRRVTSPGPHEKTVRRLEGLPTLFPTADHLAQGPDPTGPQSFCAVK